MVENQRRRLGMRMSRPQHSMFGAGGTSAFLKIENLKLILIVFNFNVIIMFK
jgi:hypothetical protein